MKKYRLNKKDMIRVRGTTLYRIVAVRSFANVKSGDKGGYVQTEKNLSHNESCWVSDNAWIYGNALVSGDAWIYGDSRIYDNARIY